MKYALSNSAFYKQYQHRNMNEWTFQQTQSRRKTDEGYNGDTTEYTVNDEHMEYVAEKYTIF